MGKKSKSSSTTDQSLELATNLAKKLNSQESIGAKTQESTGSTAKTTSKPRKISHKGARAKGLQFEREIANRLGHIFPEAGRMLEFQASKNIGVDIEGTDRIKIQCKNNQGYASISKINEIRTKDPNDIPVLVTKGNRLEAMAILPFDKFVTLLEIAYGLELPFREFVEEYVNEKQLILAGREMDRIEQTSILNDLPMIDAEFAEIGVRPPLPPVSWKKPEFEDYI